MHFRGSEGEATRIHSVRAWHRRAPLSSHIPTGLNTDQGNEGFELKTGLVNVVQASPFYGKAFEDANDHLQNFLKVSSTINPRGTTIENIHLWLFSFSLLGKTKMWFYTNKDVFTTWDACSNAFLAKYFSLGKTNTLWNRISSFQQLQDETIPEAWNVSRNTSQHAHTTAWKSG
jgi:hypothetical protein